MAPAPAYEPPSKIKFDKSWVTKKMNRREAEYNDAGKGTTEGGAAVNDDPAEEVIGDGAHRGDIARDDVLD